MTKTVFITGANRGIGLELARLHKQAGWRVVGSYRDEATAGELIELLDEDMIVQLDVKDEAGINQLPARLARNFDGLDRLINNAGVFGPRTEFDDLSAAQWLDTFHVNTIAPTQIAKVLRPMLSKSAQKSGFSQIVNISSRMGSLQLCSEQKSSFGPIYRSTKSALNMAMMCLASEIENDNIAVYLMHPGWVKTEMGGVGADLTVQQSSSDLFQTMNGLNLSDTGRFLNHNSEKIPY